MGRHCSAEDRGGVMALVNDGNSFRKIVKKMDGKVTLRQVQGVLGKKKLSERKKPARGRPRCTTPRVDRLIGTSIKENPFKFATEVHKIVSACMDQLACKYCSIHFERKQTRDPHRYTSPALHSKNPQKQGHRPTSCNRTTPQRMSPAESKNSSTPSESPCFPGHQTTPT